ncbi:hypothetical protein ASG47_02620 [Devosia sp. Leaf420]|uniref:hypothetical protein n=1 Tax=Devosia sp. Leaf420 TaxID=1736374 RepID=UPI00071576E1|nr:hypothetical protein [Devosia sp. Leaf420]KQT51795.1 hypothetical protein ASG47_02620 [Devosia sp. Leaf420]
MRLTACLTLTALLVAASPALAQKTKTVSFIDSLNQATATEAVESFVDAMEAQDFFSAYYYLSPEAKDGTYQTLASLQFGKLLPGTDPFKMEGSVIGDRTLPAVLQEDLTEGAQIFDDLMQGALVSGHAPFTFEDAEVMSITEGDADGMAEVAVSKGPSPLKLSLQKTEWGDWRVDEITWEGSAEGKPWDAGESAPVEGATRAEGPRTILDTLPTETPEDVAEAFVNAFAAGDYYQAHLLMSPAAKRALLDPMRPIMMMQFLPGLDEADLPGTGLFRQVQRADALAFDTMRDPAVVMHRLLTAAERQGVMPFSFDGAEIEGVGHVTEPSEPDTGMVAETIATVKTSGNPDSITLHLVQLPNDQWRVDRLSWVGSLDKLRPWGVPI